MTARNLSNLSKNSTKQQCQHFYSLKHNQNYIHTNYIQDQQKTIDIGKRSMVKGFEASEPWLSPLTGDLHSDVQGFIQFLERKKQLVKTELRDEIDQKLNELEQWLKVSGIVIRANESNKKSDNREKQVFCTDRDTLVPPMARMNTVDKLPLRNENSARFKVIDAAVVGSGKAVKVLLPLCEIGKLNQYNMQRNSLRCQELEKDIESKQNDSYLRSNSFVEDSDFVANFETFTRANQADHLKEGYVFDKCLRRVETTTENREIFSGFRCLIDASTQVNKVVQVFISDKVVIKRVGKVSIDSHNSCLINAHLRREFKVHKLLTELRHSSINRLVHYFEDDENIFTISVSAGDTDSLDILADHVSKFRKGIEEDIVKKWFKGVVEALVITHNLGIAHRDISLENLVLNERKCKGNGQIEIIDWGHSIGISHCGNCSYEGPLGKIRYMSPELILGKSIGLKEYNGKKADVFALGVSFFSVLTGQMPFQSITGPRGSVLQHSAGKLIQLLNKKETRINISNQAVDILNRMLCWNPEQRCTMKEVLEHPFFN